MKLKDERQYPAHRGGRKVAKADNFALLVDTAEANLAELPALYRLVHEHYRRGGVRFPVGAEGGGHSEGAHSDPTAAAVLSMFASAPECDECDEFGNCRAHMTSSDVTYVPAPQHPDGRIAKLRLAYPPDPPRDERDEARLRQSWWYPEAQMRRAMLMALDALWRLDRAKRSLVACVPQQAANLHSGRDLVTGLSDVEMDALEKRYRAPDEEPCVACGEICGPSRRGGFRDACRMAYERAGRPPRDEWIPKRRAFLAQKKAPVEPTWDPAVHTTIGPADGADRRAA